MNWKLKRIGSIAALLALTLVGNACAGTHEVAAVDATHRRLLTLDSHLDSTIHFARKGWSFGDRHDPSTEITQLDIPRMADGNC